jgi:alpha-L-rhamnosidase
MSALPEVRGQGKAGDIIVLRCFEVLDRDGNVYTANLRRAQQRVTYVLKDDNLLYFDLISRSSVSDSSM